MTEYDADGDAILGVRARGDNTRQYSLGVADSKRVAYDGSTEVLGIIAAGVEVTIDCTTDAFAMWHDTVVTDTAGVFRISAGQPYTEKAPGGKKLWVMKQSVAGVCYVRTVVQPS